MSTDQTTPPPAGSALPGSAGTAADLEPDDDGVSGLDGEPAAGLDGDRALGLDGDRSSSAATGLDGDRTTGLDGDRGALDGEPPTGLDGHARAAGLADHAPPEAPAVGPSGAAAGPATARQPAGSSWQAEASGDLVAMSFPGARRIAGWLFWVVFPLLCVATIHTAVFSTVHHLGNKPVGIRGTFVVQPRSCSQGFCSFGGLFTSDDGTIKNLPLLGDPRWHTAEVHKVTYDPRSVEVTALPGHWNPTPTMMAIIGALAYLGAIGYFLRHRRRTGQQRRAAGAEPDPVPTG